MKRFVLLFSFSLSPYVWCQSRSSQSHCFVPQRLSCPSRNSPLSCHIRVCNSLLPQSWRPHKRLVRKRGEGEKRRGGEKGSKNAVTLMVDEIHKTVLDMDSSRKREREKRERKEREVKGQRGRRRVGREKTQRNSKNTKHKLNDF